jgi:hypothetical protein
MKSLLLAAVYFTNDNLPSLLKEVAYYIESNKFQNWIHSVTIESDGQFWSGTVYEYQTINEVEEYLGRTPE